MTYQQVYSEYLEKISEALGFWRGLGNVGKGLLTKGIYNGTGTGKAALDFAKRYPLQLGGLGLGAIGANRAAGNLAYGKREPGQMSRGALGLGGLL